jgi:hypothetical protein
LLRVRHSLFVFKAVLVVGVFFHIPIMTDALSASRIPCQCIGNTP